MKVISTDEASFVGIKRFEGVVESKVLSLKGLLKPTTEVFMRAYGAQVSLQDSLDELNGIRAQIHISTTLNLDCCALVTLRDQKV